MRHLIIGTCRPKWQHTCSSKTSALNSQNLHNTEQLPKMIPTTLPAILCLPLSSLAEKHANYFSSGLKTPFYSQGHLVTVLSPKTAAREPLVQTPVGVNSKPVHRPTPLSTASTPQKAKLAAMMTREVSYNHDTDQNPLL